MNQHDNVSAHTARLTVNFLAVTRILEFDQPPLSPDMSPIEISIATLEFKGIAIAI